MVLIATRGARNPIEAALTGVAVATLLNGLILGIVSLAASSGAVQLFFLFTVGNLANRTWAHVEMVWPCMAVGVPAALVLARSANVLQLHDDVSAGLGMRNRQMRAVFVGIAALLVAGVTAVAGPIAWVGLLTPHLAGLLVARPDARLLFPAAMVLGALLLLAADVMSKLLLYPREVPVGVCTTLIAAPLILVLLRRPQPGMGW